MSSAIGDAIAVIIGRGGSKGVLRKNVRPIAGLPCCVWTMRAAMAAKSRGCLARVVVSSDCEEMLGHARAEGCEVVVRPPELASDTARVDDAMRHAIRQMEFVREIGSEYLAERRPIVMLYANVPVRPLGCIERALAVLEETRADSVQSYQRVGKMHPWWMVRLEKDGGPVHAWDGGELFRGVYRRQALPPAFVPDGAVAAMTQRALFCHIEGAAPGPHQFFGVDRRGIENPYGSVVDIDSELDVAVAEAMLRGKSA